MSENGESATEEVYEVEWIEKKRIDYNGISYYIKWKDYPGSFVYMRAFCSIPNQTVQLTNLSHVLALRSTLLPSRIARKREHLGKHRASRSPPRTLGLNSSIEPRLAHPPAGTARAPGMQRAGRGIRAEVRARSDAGHRSNEEENKRRQHEIGQEEQTVGE